MAGGFTALTLVLLSPLVRRATDHLAGDLGDPLLNTWILAWGADRLLHGLSGFWDALNFYPARNTLAYSEHLLGITVFVAPIQWATGNPVLAYNCAVLLSYPLAAGGMYLLVREVAGRRDVAVAAGLAFAFNPYRSLQVSHVQVLASGWMPIGLWALHRYFGTTSPRYLAVFAAAFVLQGLSNTYFLIFQIVPVGLVLAFELATRRIAWGRALGHLSAVGLVIAIALAPVVWAYAQVGLADHRGPTRVSLDVNAYLKAADINYVWRWWPIKASSGGRHIDEAMLFPGLTILVLAGLGLASARGTPRSRRAIALYGAVALIGLILSLGPSPTAWGAAIPVGGLYRALSDVVPGFAVIRAPARFATIALVGLVVVSALGLRWLLDKLPVRGRPVVLAGACALVLVEGTPFLWFSPFDPDRPANERAAYLWLRQRPPGGAIELPMGGAANPPRTHEYQYNTLLHGHPIVNGHSRYGSALDHFLSEPGSPLAAGAEAGQAAGMLRAVGVRYVLLHRDKYSDEALGEAIFDALRSDEEHVADYRGFAGLDVFVLREPTDGPAGEPDDRLPLDPADVVAGPAADIQPALDGDLETVWSAARTQRGREFVETALDTPRDVSRIRLALPRRLWWDYPRSVRVEAWDADGRATVLYEGSLLPSIVRGLVEHAGTGPADLALPPNRSTRLRISQTASARRPWSIGELSLWVRRSAPAGEDP